jgi:hypothetical protein
MEASTVWIIVIAAVVVLAAAAAAWLVNRNRQHRRLRERFGPEYDRTVKRAGDRRQAENALSERIARRDELELRPLSPTVAETYRRRWAQVQAEFVDRPDAAVRGAQALLDEVMVERGYPVGDEFHERVDLVSVDHPVVAENYREAHQLHSETLDAGDAPAATEKRRRALVNYRALFSDLLDGVGPAEGDTPEAATVPPDVESDRRSRRTR